jgi:hypothetical protein
METVLLELLSRLEALGNECEEVYDSEVREALSRAIFAGFIRPQREYTLPKEFAMFRPVGDRRVREILAWFLVQAQEVARRDGLSTFQRRLAAFQNRNVRTATTLGIEDFFGWAPPEQYDEAGHLLPIR